MQVFQWKLSSIFGEGGFKGLPCRVQDHVFFQGKKSMVAIHSLRARLLCFAVCMELSYDRVISKFRC